MKRMLLVNLSIHHTTAEKAGDFPGFFPFSRHPKSRIGHIVMHRAHSGWKERRQ